MGAVIVWRKSLDGAPLAPLFSLPPDTCPASVRPAVVAAAVISPCSPYGAHRTLEAYTVYLFRRVAVCLN